MREALRINPTIPVFNVTAKKDEIIGGKYHIPANELILLLLSHSHLDPKVYGDDATEFKPERMLDENFDHLNKEFPNCWKPFGNGSRACIGRPFAWQEGILVLAMLLQNFNFVLDDPNYTLSVKQTLTVKPKDLQIRAILRDGLTATQLEHKLAGTVVATSGQKGVDTASKEKDGLPGSTHLATEKLVPMSIYYGSNSGTCQSMAETLAANAFSRGFYARVVDAADNAIGKLTTDEPVVIVTASYEGQPPDNAARFVDWLESIDDSSKDFANVSYAVFGCGNRDWTSTFHRIPKLVDELMEKHGGARIASLGLSDAAKGAMADDFETWEDNVFWPAMAAKYGAAVPEEPTLTIEVTDPRTSILHYQDMKEARVVGARLLTAEDAVVKKQQIKVALPPNITYRAGDYLAVLPVNPRGSLRRVMRHFHLPWDAHLTISGLSSSSSSSSTATATATASLPRSVPIAATDIFSSYVELSQPATKRNILTLAAYSRNEDTKQKMQSLAADDEIYASEIIARRISVLDLLEANVGSIDLPLAAFLRMLPPMRMRQYSISSSPLAELNRAVLTYSVLDEESGYGGSKVGVATGYLSGLQEGDVLRVSVRPSHASFHLPEVKPGDEDKPIIMVAAGTGIAPFRGFIEERAVLLSSEKNKIRKTTLAPALFFFGCRDPDKDDLYKTELDAWETVGAVTAVYRAYSRKTEESAGCKYVQDRLWNEREEVMRLWEKGAKVYICGDRAMGEGVKNMFVRILAEKGGERMTLESAREWFEGLKNVRWAVDVFN